MKGTGHDQRAYRPAARFPGRRLLALRRQHGATRIGGRGDGAAFGPGFEIVDGIDDAPAEFAVGRAGAVGSVLFEGGRQAEKFSGFGPQRRGGSAAVSGRMGNSWVCWGRWRSAVDSDHGGEEPSAGWMGDLRWLKSPPPQCGAAMCAGAGEAVADSRR